MLTAGPRGGGRLWSSSLERRNNQVPQRENVQLTRDLPVHAEPVEAFLGLFSGIDTRARPHPLLKRTFRESALKSQERI
jgi:hypothetical protein